MALNFAMDTKDACAIWLASMNLIITRIATDKKRLVIMRITTDKKRKFYLDCLSEF